LLVSVLLALTLGGCGADGSAADGSRGTTRADADVRVRLFAGLAVSSPPLAQLVQTNRTTVTPVDVAWLRGWQVLDVEVSMPNHPKRFYAALSDDDTVLVLSGDPDSFAQMVRSAQVQVGDAATAIDVGNTYLDVTRAFDRYSYRIDSLSEIMWIPNIDSDPALAQHRADLEAQYGTLVQPPVAQPTETGWNMTVWMVYDRSLVRHSLEIAADGAVQDSPEVVETEIPVPWTF